MRGIGQGIDLARWRPRGDLTAGVGTTAAALMDDSENK